MARSGGAARHQELAVALPATPVFFNGDATRLEQVFTKLLGHGSEFIVHLPILRQAPPPPAPSPPVALERPRRILIVDDNTDSAPSMAILQTRRGHVPQVAFTGPTAIAVAAEFLLEVVLLDIGLPSMDGFDEAQAITHSTGAKAALVKDDLLRNLDIAEKLGCLTDENLWKLRHGHSPTVTSGHRRVNRHNDARTPLSTLLSEVAAELNVTAYLFAGGAVRFGFVVISKSSVRKGVTGRPPSLL